MDTELEHGVQYNCYNKKEEGYMEAVKMFYNRDNNFGDKLNVWLVKLITGRDVQYVDTHSALEGQVENLVMVGTVLIHANKHSTVWGPGLGHANEGPMGQPNILAVRGPKTRDALLAQGLSCPEVYGDPALLLKEWYIPNKTSKRYKYGFIPHYVDLNEFNLKHYKRFTDCKVINVGDSIETVIADICSCDYIISSSLHGLVAAVSYGIPICWVHITDKIERPFFKFHDFFLSVDAPNLRRVEMNDLNMDNIEDHMVCGIEYDARKLKQVCPLNGEEHE